MISVLAVHNFYRSANPSGENAVFEAETELLRSRGHKVCEYVRRSDDLSRVPLHDRIAALSQVAWSRKSYREIKEYVVSVGPEIAHFHNIFPLVSASALRACREAGLPVVQTLHNYRPICLNGLLFRGGNNCEDCVSHWFPFPGIVHRCYRNSLPYSAVAAATQVVQKQWRIWSTDVDLFIAPSDHLRQKYIAAGFDGRRIVIKPHFVEELPLSDGGRRDYVLFVGRLSTEKGLHTLIKAWRQLREIPLLVIGSGPEERKIRQEAQGLNKVTFLGSLDRQVVRQYMQGARFMVLPSECGETFSMAVLEAFASGTAVIASGLGALPELITDGYNGLLFEAKDPEDLTCKVAWLWSHPREAASFGRAARSVYETRFTPDRNYRQLLDVYKLAAGIHAAGPAPLTQVRHQAYQAGLAQHP